KTKNHGDCLIVLAVRKAEKQRTVCLAAVIYPTNETAESYRITSSAKENARMATAADLIGIWSADARYGPGAQSDEMLIFKPDGTGRMEFWNWQLCSADFFRWQVVSPGLVDLVGFRCL